MHNKLGLALISLTILSILGCSGLPNLASNTPPKQKPPVKTDLIKETFTVPYPISTVYKKWAAIKDPNTSKVVRPTGNWVPDSYGPFGQESVNFGNSIYRAYYPDKEHFTYCPSSCSVSIGLVELEENVTQVTIKYFNYRADVNPFVEEMRPTLQYLLEKK